MTRSSTSPGAMMISRGWRWPSSPKSSRLTDENETWQIRLAIGQVLDYVHTLDSLRRVDSLPPHWMGVRAVRGVVAVERQPHKPGHWKGLCDKLGIILTWPGRYDDMLAGTH